MKRITEIRADRRGAAVAQYGLIAAVAGVAIAVAALAFGSAVNTDMAAATCIETTC